MSMKGRLGFNFYDIFYISFCTLFALICFYPLWFVFLGSISPVGDFQMKTVMLLPPINPTFKYYLMIIQETTIQRALFISIAKTLLTSGGAIVITSMMAYGVSKTHVKGMKLVNFSMVFTLFFGGGLIPYYMLIVNMHLYNTFWVMVVPGFTTIAEFIIMRNYFGYSIPKELEEAAVIDGANEVIAFFKIMIPIAKPMMAAIFLFYAVANWNDWYSYLIFVTDVNLQPFIWVLRKVLTDPNVVKFSSGMTSASIARVEFIPAASLRMTTIMCATLPILLLYPFLQKHFTKGILIGAIKE